MTKRIFGGAFFSAFIAVIIALVIVMGAVYKTNIGLFTAQLNEETELLSSALNNDAESNIEILANARSFTNRITYISDSGKVLWDNRTDPADMENHAQREEFIAAKQTGAGTAVRESITLSERNVYCAKMLSDGSVIRVSGVYPTVFGMLSDLWWGVLLALILALILSALLADVIAQKIVKPINEIDLNAPDIDENYNEIAPLLHKIKDDNLLISAKIRELTRSREEFSLITENMSEGFIIVDKDARVLSYNKAALNFLGAGTDGEGKNILELNRSEDFRKAVQSALTGKRGEQTITLSGKVCAVIANTVFADEAVSGAVIIILDVTEKEARETLRREFTSNVSHELKTPLTTIYGVSDMIAGGIVKADDVGKFAADIRDESKRLITLIEDIIKLSRLDENSFDVSREKVDMLELAQLAADRLSAAAEKNSVAVSVKGESAEVVGISAVLDEIVYNLLDNAIKYNKPNGTAEINVSQDEKSVKVTVSDTGIGIPADCIDRVFERFYRVDKSRSKQTGANTMFAQFAQRRGTDAAQQRQTGGTGLGLSIVKHGAALHGGSIDIRSKESEGTAITITFSKTKA